MNSREMECWIAVVDDEALSLTNARELLTKENMKVSCLKSGSDLLKFLEKNTPDLILLDILMPEMDGFETYNKLREFEDSKGKSHIPVIFLTGENNSEMERRGLKVGASDFMHKPFNKDILIRRIFNTINNSRTIEILTEEATVDKLTGFLNKTSGIERISALCRDYTGALTILDLDNFKLVNDLFGHDMGDKVLQAFSDVVRHNTRENDVISRIGGDEFMGFFSDITGKDAIASLSDRLNKQLSEEASRLMGKEHGIPLGISIGSVMIPEHGRDYESLFALADSAMYMVKQNGKHGFAVYEQGESSFSNISDDLEREIEKITTIISERNKKSSAMLLGREGFSIVYRFIIRCNEMFGGRFTRAIFILEADDDMNLPAKTESSAQFAKLLKNSLARTDIIMQNRLNEYFAIIIDMKEDEAREIVEKFVKEWETSPFSKGINLKYSIKYSNNI